MHWANNAINILSLGHFHSYLYETLNRNSFTRITNTSTILMYCVIKATNRVPSTGLVTRPSKSIHV